MTSGPAPDVTLIGFVIGHGGDALQMLELAHGLAMRGTTVRVIVPENDETIKFQQRCSSLGVECVRSKLITASMAGARQNPLSLIWLLHRVKSPIVHLHSGNSYLPRAATASMAVLRYRRCFATLHDPYETITPGTPRADSWAAAARRHLRAVVCPSEHAAKFQIRCGIEPELVVTIRNCIDVAAWQAGDGMAARSLIGASSTDPLIVFSSRLDPQKHPIEALQIFAGIASEFPEARLVFVGQGEQSGAVAKLAGRLGLSARVSMQGYRTDVANWLAASTVWILPTERENFSVAVLEALASGCAVLSTDCPGNDEVLVDRQNSLTFMVGDVATATSRLRELLSDPDLRQRLGAGARSSAQRYTAKAMVDAYLELYRHAPAFPDVDIHDTASS